MTSKSKTKTSGSINQQLTQLGEYQIIKLLGNGSFGFVYLCEDDQQKQFAIKVLINDIDDSNRDQVDAELQTLATVESPFVVKFYQYFKTVEGQTCFLLEYCSDGNLLDYLRAQPQQNLQEKLAMKIFVHILYGFQSIHEQNIMHRDLKCENIFISKGIPKIGDFGLSLKYKENQSISLFCGTLAYLAPEILSGKKYDFRVDIWSLGVVLFMMLYGRLPFKREDNQHLQLENIKKFCDPQLDVEATLKQFQDDEDFKNIEVSEGVKFLLQEMMCIDPEERIDFSYLYQHEAVQPYLEENVNEIIKFYEHQKKVVTKLRHSGSIAHQLQQINDERDGLLRQEKKISEQYLTQDTKEQQINQLRSEGLKQKLKRAVLNLRLCSSVLAQQSAQLLENTKEGFQLQDLKLYHRGICRFTLIIDTYQNITSNPQIELSISRLQYKYVQYFLSQLIIYYANKLLKTIEREMSKIQDSKELQEEVKNQNIQKLEEIINFINQQLKDWTFKFNENLKDAKTYDVIMKNDAIKKLVVEEILIDDNEDNNYIPDSLQLSSRAAILMAFQSMYKEATYLINQGQFKATEMGQNIQNVRNKERQSIFSQINNRSSQIYEQINIMEVQKVQIEGYAEHVQTQPDEDKTQKVEPKQVATGAQANTQHPATSTTSNFNKSATEQNSQDTSQNSQPAIKMSNSNTSNQVQTPAQSSAPSTTAPHVPTHHTISSLTQTQKIVTQEPSPIRPATSGEKQRGVGYEFLPPSIQNMIVEAARLMQNALRLLLCASANRIFAFKGTGIKLSEFNRKFPTESSSDELYFNLLLDWMHCVDVETAKNQIEFILETSYPHIKDLNFDFFQETY